MHDKIEKIVDLLNDIEDEKQYMPCLDGDLQFLKLHQERFPVFGMGVYIFRDEETGYWSAVEG